MLAVAAAISEYTDAFGVANLDEAIDLRESGISKPILLLEGFFDTDELSTIQQYGFWTVIHSQHQLEMLRVSRSEEPLNIWLKMDSGMHRLGFSPTEFREAYRQAEEIPSVKQITKMTHFSSADELDSPITSQQISCFDSASSDLNGPISMANSAAILAWPKAHADWVRPGLMLYGVSPFDTPNSSADSLIPVMSFQSSVISIRDVAVGEGVGYNKSWIADKPSRIAIVAAGYGDGYPRNSKNGTPVLVSGRKAPTVGHVAMDMLAINVTEIGDVSIGQDVELWGKNLSIAEVAAYSGYSPYELMTRLTGRVEKIYHS